jgi:hypothetical protein
LPSKGNLESRQSTALLSAEALGLDEFETLSREKAYLQTALGVPVDIYSADEAGGGSQGQEQASGTGEAGDLY